MNTGREEKSPPVNKCANHGALRKPLLGQLCTDEVR